MGVWVLPEEYRKIGFFYEMDSGRCFRIERRTFERNSYMILRQTTEVGASCPLFPTWRSPATLSPSPSLCRSCVRIPTVRRCSVSRRTFSHRVM